MDNRSAREEPKKWVAGTILGIAMLFTGVVLLILQMESYAVSEEGITYVRDDIFLIISRIVLVAGGLIIILGRKRGNYYAIGVYAMTLGTSRILRSLPNLLSQNDYVFYLNIVFIIIGVNLVMSGYNHLTVRTRNPIVMRYTAIAIVGTYLMLHLYFLYAKISPTLIYEYAGDTIAYLPLYIALLFVLFSKELVQNMPMGRIKRMTDVTAQRLSAGSEISMTKEDSHKLLEGFSDPKWDVKDVGGIRLKEENIVFHTKFGKRDVVIGRWENDPDLYITLIDDHRDSFITGHRIKACGYEEHEGRIDLFDDKGICASIRILEAVE